MKIVEFIQVVVFIWSFSGLLIFIIQTERMPPKRLKGLMFSALYGPIVFGLECIYIIVSLIGNFRFVKKIADLSKQFHNWLYH